MQRFATLPRRLYKFAVPERVDVLRTGMIRFTQPSALNDPFELRPMFDALVPEDEFEERMRPTEAMLEELLYEKYMEFPEAARAQLPFGNVLEKFRENPSLIETALAQVMPSMRNLTRALTPVLKDKMAEVLNREIGILSLSASPTNPVLWAHYASNHKGLVFEFDATNDFFCRKRGVSDEFYHVRQVQYLTLPGEDRSMIEMDGDSLLCTKSAEWAYEEEWRMLMPLRFADKSITSDGDDIHLFSIPKPAITAVVVGAKATASTIEKVKRSVSTTTTSHIEMRQATISSGAPVIQFVPLA